MTRILMIGHRQGLVEAALKQGLDFLLWNNKELNNPPPSRHLVRLPWPQRPGDWPALAERILALGPFEAIIAGSERAIPLVAALRRATGLGPMAPIQLLRCHDKLLMKNHLRAAGFPLNPYLWGETLTVDQIWQTLGPRIVCKDRMESGGRSIQIYSRKSDLSRELPNRQRLFEAYNPHPEYSVESFIIDGRIRLTNITQYYVKQHINILPAHLPASLEHSILDLNQRVITHMGIPSGITHMELYLGEDGPVFGEIAVRPPGGYIMELLELAYGFSTWEAYLNIERGLPCAFPDEAPKAAAAHVLHPGPGVVQAIKGWHAVRHHPSVHRAKLKVGVGETIKFRAAVGEDVGFVLQSAVNQEALMPAVDDIRRLLQWTMDGQETG